MTETVQTIEAPSAPVPSADLDSVVKEVFGEDSPSTAEGMPDAPSEAKEATPEPAEEKAQSVSARILAAKRAEMRAERQRQEVQALREQLSKRQAEQEAKEAELRLIEEDPSKFFELKKMGPEAIREHLEKLAGTYEPKAVADKKLSTLEQELKSLREELARRDSEQTTQLQRAQAESQWKEAAGAFVEHVTSNADSYPHLTEEFTESEAAAQAFRVLNEVVGTYNGRPITRNEAYRLEHGEFPDNDVVAEYLNALAKERIDARSSSAWRRRDNAPTAGKAPLGDATKSRANGAGSPRTLSARDTSQRASAPKKWTQEDADAESLRILEQAFRGKR